MSIDTTRPLLEVNDLGISLKVKGEWTPVVEEVSFSVDRGQALGIVGESGSGKSLTALSLMRLLPEGIARIDKGSIVFEGVDLVAASPKTMTGLRGAEIAMIFQEPMTSLNPAFTVGHQLAEGVRRHRGYSRKKAWDWAVECLRKVEISDPGRQARSYPHQLSGGMRQRAMIAMAITCGPKLLIADEPTTALDVTIQAQILELLGRMSEDMDLSVILVSHDFGVISEVCDDVLVMYGGHLMESGPALPLFAQPRHPYLAALLAATPSISATLTDHLAAIPGTPPVPGRMPPGCRFAPRCDFVEASCQVPVPVVADDVRLVRCVRHDQLDLGALR